MQELVDLVVGVEIVAIGEIGEANADHVGGLRADG